MGYCEQLLRRRVAKVGTLLGAISRFPDAQGSFCLLRSCTVCPKVLYSCRTVPPVLQPDGLRAADTDVLSSLGRLVGGPPSPTTTGG